MYKLKNNPKTAVIIILITFILGYITAKLGINYTVEWPRLEDVYGLLSQEFLEQKGMDRNKLTYGTVRGMLSTLNDPYSVFLIPSEHRVFQQSLTRIFEGTGVQLNYKDSGRFLVEEVLPESPGEKNGITKGDVIAKINGMSVSEISISRADEILKAPAGAEILIELNNGRETGRKNVKLVSEVFIVKSVQYFPSTTPKGTRVGVMKVFRFGRNTIAEWKQAADLALNDRVEALVLDLRENLGGFTEVPEYIGSDLLSEGVLYIRENRDGHRKSILVSHPPQFSNIPLVVLINKNTISATEFLAGAIRYHNRGKLVGERSFGKGTFQKIFNLEGGEGVHLTTDYWYLPDGSSVEKKGLTPDFEVTTLIDSEGDKSDMQLKKALEVLDMEEFAN